MIDHYQLGIVFAVLVLWCSGFLCGCLCQVVRSKPKMDEQFNQAEDIVAP